MSNTQKEIQEGKQIEPDDDWSDDEEETEDDDDFECGWIPGLGCSLIGTEYCDWHCTAHRNKI